MVVHSPETSSAVQRTHAVTASRRPIFSSLQHIGNAIYGLRNVELSDEWAPMMRTWLSDSEQLLRAEGISFKDTISILQSLLLVSYNPRIAFLKGIEKWGLRQQFDEVVNEAWIVFDMALKALPSNGYRSRSERKHAEKIIESCQSLPGSLVATNEYLFGFECDVVTRSSGDGYTKITDYEIDGIHHRQITKKHFCRLRDEYLKTRGVKVIRKIVA